MISFVGWKFCDVTLTRRNVKVVGLPELVSYDKKR